MRQHAPLTVRAHAAAGDAGDKHGVTRFVEADIGADFVDDTDTFVLEIAENIGQLFRFSWVCLGGIVQEVFFYGYTYPNGNPFLACWNMSLEDMEVGATDGGILDLDDRIRGFLDVGDGFIL